MKKILLIIIICFFNQLNAQEKVELKEIYFDDNLAYKISDNGIFSGQAQKIRKNGHLVYEEFYKDGFLIKTIVYYNRTEIPTPAIKTEFYENSFDRKKETNYGLSNSNTEFKYFDHKGNKTLIERYESDKLTYRCEYLNDKKHGIEFCLTDNETELKIEYKHGKKVKNKNGR